MTIARIFAAGLALAATAPSPAHTDTDVCTAVQKQRVEAGLKQAEDAERAGRLNEWGQTTKLFAKPKP